MAKTTTIQVEVSTIKRLKKHKPTPTTTWDWVVNNLLDQVEGKGKPK